MQRRGTHLFSLPSALKKRGSSSTLNSSNDSALTQSPEAPTIALPTSSRSSLSSSQDDHVSIYHDWSLLAIDRVPKSPGMVLVALYHLSTDTMYTWPLQTDPSAPQPKQGTVFIAALNGESGDQETVTSESLKVLTGVLLTWMRQKSQSKTKVRLGERAEDTKQLGSILDMPRIDDAHRLTILDRQVVRPLQEWGGEGAKVEADRKGKERVLSSLNTNTNTNTNTKPSLSSKEEQSSSKLAPPRLPSIEITSPNTTELLSKQNVPWLQERKPSYVL